MVGGAQSSRGSGNNALNNTGAVAVPGDVEWKQSATRMTPETGGDAVEPRPWDRAVSRRTDAHVIQG